MWEEEEVGDIRLLLHNVSLQIDKVDKWMWRLETSSLYSVCSAYKFLNANLHVDLAVSASSLWHKDVPLKVVLFA